MQSGRKPLESAEEYADRKSDYLNKIRMATAMIVICTVKLEEAMKTLEEDYNLDFPEWGAVFSNLNEIGKKTTEFVENFIRTRE
jgi:nitrogenase molybdenum-iron protein alpha/beta subunit